MRGTSNESGAIASGHPAWITVRSVRTVLIVVHTMTAWNRFADILPVFDSDRRVQILFTFPDASHVTGDVQREIRDAGGIVIPWQRAISESFDLAISAHHSGELHRIKAQVAVLSHGIGYTKIPRIENRESRIENRESRIENRESRIENVYGLGRQWLVRDGVVPDAVVLSHEYDLIRLARLTPEAVPNAVVAGDPCLDRLRASTALRQRYRRALGAEAGTTVVTVTSTWGPGSLLGQHPDLIGDLLSELTMDDHIVATVIHPNAWFAHGPWQLRVWLADALRAGLRLIPPLRGWQHTILASDVVIGDHGAVTGYAAALLIPTLLAAFPRVEVATGTVIHELGGFAPALNPNKPLPEQISNAIHTHDRARALRVAELASSRPGTCADTLRSTFYRLMDLPEPLPHAPVFTYAPTDLVPHREQVTACWLAFEWAGDARNTAEMHRWPAEVTARPRRGPRTVDGLLAVHAEHPRRDLRGSADVVVLTEVDAPEVDETLARTVRERPACAVAVVALDDTRYRWYHRALGTWEAHGTAVVAGPMAAAVVAAAVHDQWLLRRAMPTEILALRIHTQRILFHIKQIDSPES